MSARTCIGLVSHLLNAPVRAVFERLRAEAPPGCEVRMIFSTDDPNAGSAGLAEEDIDRISAQQVFALPYPTKCQATDWDMAGNLDAVFLEFFRRHPDHDRYWFVEYDVFWQGHWSVFFDHFDRSEADLLAATIHRLDAMPHKADIAYPVQVVPEGMAWERAKVLKAFLPICRLSNRGLRALDAAYRAGLGGHYEINVPSVLAQNGMDGEDYGGDGAFVRPDNLNRFYFARGDTFSHSPGTFVFRPAQHVLRRQNTLWHPVKPEGVPVWFPLAIRGNLRKNIVEWTKPHVGRLIIRWWFAVRWRPLRTAARGMEAARSRSGG